MSSAAEYAHHFSQKNVPFGIASSPARQRPRAATRIGNTVIWLEALHQNGFFSDIEGLPDDAWSHEILNSFASLPKSVQSSVRRELQDAFERNGIDAFPVSATEDIGAVTMHLPVAIGDFADFSCSLEHVKNAGRIIVNDERPPPAFFNFPIGYQGRASSIVVSGTEIERPWGQFRNPQAMGPDASENEPSIIFGPSQKMDYELELAAIIGKPLPMRQRLNAVDADEHIFGFVILNDWSSRDIQGFEMMPLGPFNVKDLHKVDETSFPYIFEQNATVTLKAGDGLVRCNIYRPKSSGPVPVLVTYGPYGKDIPYKDFHPQSFSEVNEEQKSEHSAWETPDPGYWTRNGYAVVRADERGLGQSTGLLDTMSRGTSEAFFDVVEWAADQPWSNGKVGLLGISYYAGSQWRVAARRPKGLAAIVPWEGMSDYYRDRCRHGGILSNSFIKFWWNRQVITNQYGRPGRSARNWGPDTIEGDLEEEELAANRRDQNTDNRDNKFRDDPYYASKEYDMGDIEVPLLSVGNWGGILLHLRGNIEGYLHAGSKLKYLRMVTGRHDLPFYYKEEVEVQRSFLDAFLKGEDRVGWSEPGKVSPVTLVLRKGDAGFNDAEKEKNFPRREEQEWPIARTQYTQFHLTPDLGLTPDAAHESLSDRAKLSYRALGSLDDQKVVQFVTPPFEAETEVTGHVTAHLNVSVTPDPSGPTPSDIDLFVTLRHIGPTGQEIYYTGTAGDPVPLTKGWLRVSLRKINKEHAKHREWLPHRDYTSKDVLPVIQGEVYAVDVEIWPTNVVVEQGGKLVFEVSSGDTQGSGIFKHDDPSDRSPEKLQGTNHIHFGPGYQNYVTLPIIPQK
ncbi:hypothetical protein VDGE_09808 [Verticillium dahliae]|uniref:Xaa-Pro dipeptidyl-peptidase C-terminal domain-containing protein n=1 Tax=Verticillium dahliae TaxID=27337 RepID=A0A444RNM2_VERDA|nr:hypothetical protein VDGE_09808 [Verticillium dahliae]